MTDGPISDQSPVERSGAVKASGIVTPARRKFIVGAAPFIVTLANRSALGDPLCALSNLMSANLSHHAAVGTTTNCAVTPACWSGIANGDGGWASTAYSPGMTFASVFGNPGALNADGTWQYSSSTTLLTALGGTMAISFRKNAPNIFTNTGALAQETVCALLNASAYSSINGQQHFPLNTANVISTITTMLGTSPNNAGQFTGAPANTTSITTNFFNTRPANDDHCTVAL